MTPPRLALWILVVTAGCVDRGDGPQSNKVDPGYVPKHLLAQEPSSLTRVDVSLGGKVIYLGNNVAQTRIVPGGLVKLKHYWKVIAPVGPGWRVFTVLRGQPGYPDFINLPATDMQQAHGPATWRAGEIIEDEQEFTMRPDWKSASATLFVGLIQDGKHGAGDRMAASGPSTEDRAVVARTFEVDLARAPPPPGTIHVPHAIGPIQIDGSPADPGWATALTSPEFLTGEGSGDSIGKATAKITWDQDHLYLFILVNDSDIFSEFKNQDDPLWKQDCVELFIDADGNRRGYVELQVNPNNATFDSWFAGGRAPKGDEAWDSGMITAVKVRGTADVAGDGDQGWEVEIAIPWQAIKGGDPNMAVKLPPQVGDRWRMNVVRVDKRTGASQVTVSSWNRISVGDFHGLDRMLTVVFADTVGGTIPGSVPVRSGAAGGAGSGAGSGDELGGSGAGSAGAESGSAGSGSAGSGVKPPAQMLQPAPVRPTKLSPAADETESEAPIAAPKPAPSAMPVTSPTVPAGSSSGR
ncbi:MAG: carbohydrate-binding family 9-like protein [Kofleriaceae bacterium]